MTGSVSEIWKTWNDINTFLFLSAVMFFCLNISCLFIIYVKLDRKIDAHTCQQCTKEPERNPLNRTPIRESSFGISPIIEAEDDSETESSESSDYSDNKEKHQLSKPKTITYTTVHFDNKKQLPDYEDIVETPDYVNVDLKGIKENNKKLKRNVKTVEYTTVVPMPVPFRRPSHPPATATDSSSS